MNQEHSWLGAWEIYLSATSFAPMVFRMKARATRCRRRTVCDRHSPPKRHPSRNKARQALDRVKRPYKQSGARRILPHRPGLILPSEIQDLPLFRPPGWRKSARLIRGAVMGGDAIRAIVTSILFLMAFPALCIIFKTADPHLKAIVGAAVFCFPCLLLLGEDLLRSKRSACGTRKIEKQWVGTTTN
jgi:hypothetical protein